MCLAYPARIVALDSTDAVVDVGGRRRRASLLMRPEVAAGDWVLVAAGSVIRRIEAAEAHELDRLIGAAASRTNASPSISNPPGGPR